jgi:DNA-binding protein H-NS
MSKLIELKRKIAALEAQAERIAKQEMAGAIAKVSELMATYGLTIEHIRSATKGIVRSAGKSAKAKRASTGTPKYADPKSGKTWTGYGRAPAWIAGAKDRDAFLVGTSEGKGRGAAGTISKARKKTTPKLSATAKTASLPTAKKRLARAKKATAPVAKRSSRAAAKAALKPAAKRAPRSGTASKARSKAATPAETASPSAE